MEMIDILNLYVQTVRHMSFFPCSHVYDEYEHKSLKIKKENRQQNKKR
jgi:hypothetical protein